MTPSVLMCVLCLAVAYAGFCRLTHMSLHSTVAGARWAAVALVVSALATVWFVLFWGYSPGWPALLLPAAYLMVLAQGARAWRTGLPAWYRK